MLKRRELPEVTWHVPPYLTTSFMFFFVYEAEDDDNIACTVFRVIVLHSYLFRSLFCTCATVPK